MCWWFSPPRWGGFPGLLQHAGLHALPRDGAPVRLLALALISTVLMTSFGTWACPEWFTNITASGTSGRSGRGVIISTFFSLLCGGRLLHRVLLPPVFWGGSAEGRHGLHCSHHAQFRRAAQPAHRGYSGAADLRLGVHPVQHHPSASSTVSRT